jgi:hypothetical protein
MPLLERLGAGNEARVTRAWAGKKVVCIGGGPSLTQQQLELIRRARAADTVRVIVINDQYLVAPWADLIYFADMRWHGWHAAGEAKSWPWAKFSAEEAKRAYEEFQGEKVTIRRNRDPAPLKLEPQYPASVSRLANLGCDGFSADPNGIYTGNNGGFQALNIAALSGGAPIQLVAYDMHFNGDRTHSHNGHRERVAESAYRKDYAKRFRFAKDHLNAAGIRVVNCTPGSALDCFPMSTIEKELG